FVRTAYNVTDQMIKDYIYKHESRDDKFGNFQVEN
ncbi:MAG: IS200/IS605 family transposase, partial [Rickettsia endosymbiont of Ixodes persulcatus]|nr:IS200/IS605 family transposase [Rickettsia endosymbiont of Ixodes persulcatus]